MFVLPNRRSGKCSRYAGGQEIGFFLGRIDPTAFRPTQSRPALPPRRAPPRLDRPVVCPDFGFDRLLLHIVTVLAVIVIVIVICIIIVIVISVFFVLLSLVLLLLLLLLVLVVVIFILIFPHLRFKRFQFLPSEVSP